jgi:hypothetical protein
MERRSCLMQCKCAISNYGTWPTPDRIAVDRHLIRCCCHTRIVSEGTSPAGSMWAKNPIPRSWRNQTGGWGIGSNQMQTGEGFQPVCVDTGMDKNGNLRSCTSEWGEHCLNAPSSVATVSYSLSCFACDTPRSMLHVRKRVRFSERHAKSVLMFGGHCGALPDNTHTCTADGISAGPYNMEIVDMVKIPADLTPGAYVLGWRWVGDPLESEFSSSCKLMKSSPAHATHFSCPS